MKKWIQVLIMKKIKVHQSVESLRGAGLKFSKVSASLGAGFSEVYQKSSSNVLTSFMDVDRDGLLDIVESGKSFYLKNIGNCTFTKDFLYTNVSIKDVEKTFTEDEKNSYDETYFIKTPFRFWKAKFDGIVSIKEAHILFRKINNSSTQCCKTFIGNDASDAI